MGDPFLTFPKMQDDILPLAELPPFASVNGRFDDAYVEEYAAQTLLVWLGSCCQYCTPNPMRVRFAGVLAVKDLNEAAWFSDPVFRLATRGELEASGLEVPRGSTAFCLSSGDEAPEGPRLYVVARAVDIVPPAAAP